MHTFCVFVYSFFFLFYCTWSVKGSHFNRPSHFGWRIYHIIYYLYPPVTSTGNYAILFVFTVHCGWRICCGVCIHSSLWLENMPWCLYPQFAVAGGHAMVFVSSISLPSKTLVLARSVVQARSELSYICRSHCSSFKNIHNDCDFDRKTGVPCDQLLGHTTAFVLWLMFVSLCVFDVCFLVCVFQQAGLHPTADQIELFAYHLPHATLSNLMVSSNFISMMQLMARKGTASFAIIIMDICKVPTP